MIEQTDKIS